jgi:hypothetical protein
LSIETEEFSLHGRRDQNKQGISEELQNRCKDDINESPRKVKAYLFFKPKTVPDIEPLALLNNERHEIALHVVNSSLDELKNLEKFYRQKDPILHCAWNGRTGGKSHGGEGGEVGARANLRM